VVREAAQLKPSGTGKRVARGHGWLGLAPSFGADGNLNHQPRNLSAGLKGPARPPPGSIEVGLIRVTPGLIRRRAGALCRRCCPRTCRC